jgi:hypothetical protein
VLQGRLHDISDVGSGSKRLGTLRVQRNEKKRRPW